jgi:hypothetical protein
MGVMLISNFGPRLLFPVIAIRTHLSALECFCLSGCFSYPRPNPRILGIPIRVGASIRHLPKQPDRPKSARKNLALVVVKVNPQPSKRAES